MTRAELTRTLGEMERLRMDTHETSSHREAIRLQREYDQLWDRIRPYCIGELPCSDDPQPQAA